MTNVTRRIACKSLLHGSAAPNIPRWCILEITDILANTLWSQLEAANAVNRATGIMGADGVMFLGKHVTWATRLEIDGNQLDPDKAPLDQWMIFKDVKVVAKEFLPVGADKDNVINYCKTEATPRGWQFEVSMLPYGQSSVRYTASLRQRELVELQQEFKVSG